MQEIIRHRQVLLAACAGVAFSIAAIPPFVLSVFAGPMTREFGWSLQQFQSATFAVPLGILIAAPPPAYCRPPGPASSTARLTVSAVLPSGSPSRAAVCSRPSGLHSRNG